MSDACCATLFSFHPPPQGSRRRRIWEMDDHAQCPLVGVCLPVDALRRLAAKEGFEAADDYALHCIAVTECKRRSPLAERVQKDLERRHAPLLRSAAQCKCSDSLATWWRCHGQGAEVAGAFWAVLSHPRCHTALERQVLGELHMLQHALGHRQREDDQALAQALAAQRALEQQLQQAQTRTQQNSQAHALLLQTTQAEVLRLRALLLARETLLAQREEELAVLRHQVPDLPARAQLAAALERQVERNRALQRELAQRECRALAAAPCPAAPPPAPLAPVEVVALGERAVLCVGGRTAAVPLYRRLVEAEGARFMHHDGGAEDKPQRLDAQLEAADLVICQVGCISHDAYWRVKDHCKRHGTRCVFVEQPSLAGLQRALREAAK